jgi:multiple sugar transport system permease protein
MNERRAAWLFTLPALVVIGLFFFVPVLAAFVLSLTDFDLYALASLDNLRFVWLGNYVDILKTPLF